MALPPLAGTIWQHFKGHVYVVVAVARHSETLEWMVVYREGGEAYRERESSEGENTWVRPLSMWEEVVTHNGKQTKRFTQLE